MSETSAPSRKQASGDLSERRNCPDSGPATLPIEVIADPFEFAGDERPPKGTDHVAEVSVLVQVKRGDGFAPEVLWASCAWREGEGA